MAYIFLLLLYYSVTFHPLILVLYWWFFNVQYVNVRMVNIHIYRTNKQTTLIKYMTKDKVDTRYVLFYTDFIKQLAYTCKEPILQPSCKLCEMSTLHRKIWSNINESNMWGCIWEVYGGGCRSTIWYIFGPSPVFGNIFANPIIRTNIVDSAIYWIHFEHFKAGEV